MMSLIKNNITTMSIIIFISLYSLFIYYEPSFMYDNDGSLRNFGLGFKKKTIIPAWLLSIILSIISYFLVLYYLTFPKLINN